MGFRRLVVLGCAVAVIGGVGAYLGRRLSNARTTAKVTPKFATAETRTIAAAVVATGTVRLRVGAEVRVGAQVSGIVKTLNVTVGSHIRTGDVIAEIDSSGLEARLAQARAQVAVAQRDVRRAEIDLGRARQLDERQLIPRQQAEDAALSVEEAKARLAKAERDADVVETDRSYAVIRAPITGTVASVSTQEGETVAAAFAAPTFVTIIGDHALQLVAMVDETDIGVVSAGNRVTFSVEAYTDREFEGRVERIAPKATIVSGVVNYEVIIAIDSAADVLKPDMTANISIRTAERQAVVVTNAAIQRDGDARFVLLERDGSYVQRSVSVGARDGSTVEVKKGLVPGERVLLEPMPTASAKESRE
jgi:macrolide-specific efflux system membrane fusion protein